MTTQTEPTKLKWHKAKYGGDWEAEYVKPWAVNSYDNKTCTVTILKDDDLWKFCSSEEWENSDTDGIEGFKTLKEAKAAAQEATDSDFWSSSEDEEDPDPDYLDFKAKTIAMKQEYLNGLSA